MRAGPAPGAGGNGPGRPPGAPEPLIRVGDDFEDEYPGASALATECYANLYRAATMSMDLHNRQTREEYQLSPSAREILAIIEGAGQPLEPSVIAERLLITTGSMTSRQPDALRRADTLARADPPAATMTARQPRLTYADARNAAEASVLCAEMRCIIMQASRSLAESPGESPDRR